MAWWEPKQLVPRLFHGIEAGVVGGLAMLAPLVAGALWRGDPWWMPPNLLGSTFYGERALHSGPNRATLAGGAFHIVITGAVGAVFGLACGGVHRRGRLVLLGTLAGLIWHSLADAVLWRPINPLVSLYSPQPATLLSHAFFGACLGYMGRKLPPPSPHDAGPEGDRVE